MDLEVDRVPSNQTYGNSLGWPLDQKGPEAVEALKAPSFAIAMGVKRAAGLTRKLMERAFSPR